MNLRFASIGYSSLRGQLIERIVLSLVIAFIGGLIATLAIYWVSDVRSRRLQQEELAIHFRSRIAKLDNALMVQADVLRVQLEFNRLLEAPGSSHQKITAYLNSIGGQQVFSHVKIFDSTMRPLYGYTARSERLSKGLKVQGKEGLSWVYSPETETLYRSVEQKIWMGGFGNGWLLLYVPMDNTLLESVTFPGTALSLYFDGKVLTSTDTKTSYVAQTQEVKVVLPWGSDVARPELVVRKAYRPPTPLLETLAIMGMTTLLTLALGTSLIARWLGKLVSRLRYLGEAAALFGTGTTDNTNLRIQLALASGIQVDEVSALVQSIQLMMNNVQAAQAELESSEQKFISIFRHSPIALALSRMEDDVCIDVNASWTKLFDRSRADVVGRAMSEAVTFQDAGQRVDIKAQLATAPNATVMEASLNTAKGIRYAKLSIEKIFFAGSPFLIEGFDDITERKLSEAKINQLAYFDQLTGLPNRTLLRDRLGQLLASHARAGQHSATLMIDLDNFKMINDTRGHLIGDQLLQDVARRMQQCVREGDTVARVGGDEFIVLLLGLSAHEADAANDVEVAAQKLLAVLAQPFVLAGRPHHCTASIGITLFKDLPVSVDELLKQADLAMYRSKAAGKNAMCFFKPSLEHVVTERAKMERNLRHAIAEQQFELYYQLQVTEGGAVSGAECLLRWPQADGHMVSPADFIELAEDTGLIVQLGQWVLETACTQLATWSEDSQMAHLVLAINVSAVQFRQPHYGESVLATLTRTRANPKRLKIELTESVLVSDINETIAVMHRLKACGVGFSLDDFGTGFSSLAYLKRLPLDQLKIDQMFVRDLLSNPNDAAIAKTIIALGQSLNLAVIAEGVETQAQRAFLVQLGCYAFQGYLFGKPAPLAAFEASIRAVRT